MIFNDSTDKNGRCPFGRGNHVAACANITLKDRYWPLEGGSGSTSSSSAGRRYGSRCSSLSQRPRSICRQRALQNGIAGEVSESNDFPQVGQFSDAMIHRR
jgi:hypothetical protein